MNDLKANLMAKHNDNGCRLGGRYRTSMEMQKMDLFHRLEAGLPDTWNGWWPNVLPK